jgi:large repetitive protein
MRNLLGWILMATAVSAAPEKPATPTPVNTPPRWRVSQIELGSAFRATPFEATLPPDSAEDGEKDALTYRMVAGSGPAWLKVTPEGRFSGTPGASDRGAQSWSLEVRDGKTSAAVPVLITVGNRPPVLAQGELTLPDATEEKTLTYDLIHQASDPDRDALTFSKGRGPDWLQVSPAGKLTGIPPEGSNGTLRAQVEVSDGEKKETLSISGKINQKNYAPTIQPEIAFRAKEREPFTADLARSASDRNESDKLTFALKGPKPLGWVTLSPSGELSANPTYAEIGNQTISFTVSDGALTSAGSLSLAVERNPRPPVWAEQSPSYKMKSREAFSASVAKSAKDPDGIALTFSKRRGPSWLQISPKGELSGTPSDRDAGESEATVVATNDKLSAEWIVRLSIEKKNYLPTVLKPLEVTVKEREVTPVQIPLLGVVNDPDGEALTYTSAKLPTWVSLSNTGELTAKPLYAQIGVHRFTVSARDREAAVELPVVLTVARNPRPPVWSSTPTFTLQTRVAFKASVNAAAKDADGLPVSFKKLRGPDWLLVSEKGELSGTPADADAGQRTAEIAAANDLASAPVTLTLDITKKNYPPVFSKAFEASIKEREVATLEIGPSGSVVDPDAEPLTFSATKLPAWVALSSAGTLTAKPLFAQVGVHRFSVTARDREAGVEVPVVLTVVRSPQAPVWNSPAAFTIKTREPFKASLAKYARDIDGVPLTFKKLRGPAWIDISDKGELSGTPTDTDAGKPVVEITATNDGAFATVPVAFEIEKKNYPPVLAKPLEITVKERETPTIRLAASGNVVDPDAEALTFTSSKVPSWVELSPTGELTLKPLFAQIGQHKFTITVRDRQASVDLPVTLTVARNPRPPVWQSTPTLSLKTREPFKFSLAGLTKDADGLNVRFTKIAGPLWLAVSEKGELSGTPADLDAGTSQIEIAAANDLQSAPAILRMEVIKKNYPPQLVKPFTATVKERDTTPLSVATSGSVVDPDGEKLEFSATKLPAWAQLNAEGALTVSPLYAQIGQHKFTVSAKDREQSVEIPVVLTVARNPRPPVWTESTPFTLKTREVFKASLTSKVKDQDGVALKFSKASGPDWVVVSEKGELSGTPADTDAGTTTLSVTATNDGASASTPIRFQITKKNYPPRLAAKEYEATVKERETGLISLSKSGAVVDPDAEALSYSAAKLPAWVTLSPGGDLAATPAFAQIGQHRFTVTAKDSEASINLPVVLTVVRNPRPPAWTSATPAPFTLKTRDAFKASVAGQAKDLDGLTVRYSKVSGPEWLLVSEKGEFSGTPKDLDAGKADAVIAASNDKASAPLAFTFDVVKKNYLPQLAKPFDASVKEREVATLSLSKSDSVVDPDGEALTYTFSKPAPPWASLSADGTLTLEPQFAQIGLHRWTVSVKDKEGGVELPVVVTVLRNPRGPQWNEEKLVFNLLTREPFKTSFASKVKDLDGKPFNFALVSSPPWLKLSQSGELTAEPQDADAGTTSFVVAADNRDVASPKTVTLVVKTKNHPPVLATAERVFTCKERGACRWNLADPAFVTDIDRDRLTFTLKETAPWIALEPNGSFQINPAFAQIGKHTLHVKIADAESSIDALVQVQVDRDPRPPVWNEKKIALTSKAREPLKASISEQARDLDGLPIKFTKTAGPDWLNVSPTGALTGSPTDDHVGKHKVTVEAANDLKSALTTFTLEILHKNHAPKWAREKLEMGNTRADEMYSTSIRGLASDSDPNSKLTFEKVRGPAWAIVAPDGQVFGKPGLRDAGEQQIVVRVLDAQREPAEAVMKVNVTGSVPRPATKENPVRIPTAYTGELFAYNLKKVFGNWPYGYKMLTGPKWLLLAPAGELSGVPPKKEDYDFTFQVISPRGDVVEFAGHGKIGG